VCRIYIQKNVLSDDRSVYAVVVCRTTPPVNMCTYLQIISTKLCQDYTWTHEKSFITTSQRNRTYSMVKNTLS
jgi:hypothetical protein